MNAPPVKNLRSQHHDDDDCNQDKAKCPSARSMAKGPNARSNSKIQAGEEDESAGKLREWITMNAGRWTPR